MSVPTMVAPVAVWDEDTDVLIELVLARAVGRAPAWSRLRINVAGRVVEIRVPRPADVTAWHAALGSEVEVRAEPGGPDLVWHSARITDRWPGWEIFVGCREDLSPAQREAEC